MVAVTGQPFSRGGIAQHGPCASVVAHLARGYGEPQLASLALSGEPSVHPAFRSADEASTPVVGPTHFLPQAVCRATAPRLGSGLIPIYIQKMTMAANAMAANAMAERKMTGFLS